MAPLIRIVDSEAVCVNGVRAEVHQLVNAASVAGLKFTVALIGSQLHNLASAVSHVDLELLRSGVGEEHDPLGVEVVALLAMYLR